jgi:hypothetical protein
VRGPLARRGLRGNLSREASGQRNRGETDQSNGSGQPGSDHGQPFAKQIVTACVGIVANNLYRASD